MATGFYRYQIREEVARVFTLHEAVATGGTTATLVDSKLARFANDYWINAQVFIKWTTDSLAPVGETSYVTDFVASTGTLTCSPVFSVAPASGDTYQLYRYVTKDQIDNAISRVCVGAEIITSLTPSTTSLDYVITAAKGLRRRQQMIGVWRRELGNDDALPYPLQGWQFEDAEGALTLRIPYLLNSTDQLWIHYYAGEDIDEECEVIGLPMLLMRARVVVYLLENLMAPQDAAGRESWGMMLRYWVEQRDSIERQHQRVPTKVTMHRWAYDLIGGGKGSQGEQSLGLVSNYGGNFASYP